MVTASTRPRSSAWAAMLALAGTLYNVELSGKRLDQRLRELREALS